MIAGWLQHPGRVHYSQIQESKPADSTLPTESSCGVEPQLSSNSLPSRFLRVPNWNPDTGVTARSGTAASATSPKPL